VEQLAAPVVVLSAAGEVGLGMPAQTCLHVKVERVEVEVGWSG